MVRTYFQNQLSNDLAHEFTTTNYGDEVVTNGTMVALAGIKNYPYTILFNLDDKMMNDIANHKPYPRPSIDLDNGWYQIDVLAGMKDDERAFEFLIKPTSAPKYTADVFRLFDF